MKKIAIFCSALLLFTGCSQEVKTQNTPINESTALTMKENPNSSMQKEMPKDFELSFYYGNKPVNGINTSENTLSKDLGDAGTKAADYKISKDNKAKIYAALRNADIITYPEDYKPTLNDNSTSVEGKAVTTGKKYKIAYVFNGKQYSLEWDDNNFSKDPKAVQLRNTFEMIIQLIESTEEYKSLS